MAEADELTLATRAARADWFRKQRDEGSAQFCEQGRDDTNTASQMVRAAIFAYRLPTKASFRKFKTAMAAFKGSDILDQADSIFLKAVLFDRRAGNR